LNYSAVWAAVNLIAGAVGSLPLKQYLVTDDGRTKQPYLAHPIYRLVHDSPNPEMSIVNFLEAMTAHALLWGNAFAEIVRSSDGRPLAMWPITPDRVSMLRRADGGLQYRVVNNRGGDALIDREDMLHLRGLSPDGVWGYSDWFRPRKVTKKTRRQTAMAKQQQPTLIEGRPVQIVAGEYGFTGIDTRPERKDLTPEERERERQADRIGYRQLLTELGLTDEEFLAMRGIYSFPAAVSQAYNNWGRFHEARYSRQQIREWLRNFRGLAQKLGNV
jgi:HK97 family phage portal protein